MKFTHVFTISTALALVMSAGLAHARPELSFGYSDGWAESVASTFVAAEVIKQQLGYEVKLMPVAAGIMWQGVATGKLDMMVSAWLPVTHREYWIKDSDQVVNYGSNFVGAKIGLIVPDYVSARSIADLKNDDGFGKKIVGIDAGAGVMTAATNAIKTYDLTGYKLQASSSAAMTAELNRAYNKNQPIVVTGWSPHWLFAKWKMHFLDDPDAVFSAAEHVDNIGSKQLEGKAPEVAAFLKKFAWKDGNEIGAVMLAIQEGKKPQEVAQEWVAAHPERVAEWVAR